MPGLDSLGPETVQMLATINVHRLDDLRAMGALLGAHRRADRPGSGLARLSLAGFAGGRESRAQGRGGGGQGFFANATPFRLEMKSESIGT